MKKLYALLFFCLAYIAGSAQSVNIPDPNFKAKLLSTSEPVGFDSFHNIVPIDTNGDGQIQVSEAQNIHMLWVMSANISDLTGIESFVNLRELNCNDNNLTNLDVSSLPFLTDLHCANNSITALNLTNLNLQSLYCNNNLLTSLDLHILPALKYIYCSNNLLTSLNIDGMSEIFTLHCSNNQLTSLDFSAITSYLLSVDCSNNNISTLDLSVRTNTNPIANQLNCSFNPNLTYLNTQDGKTITASWSALKTGMNDLSLIPPPLPESTLSFEGTPNLQYFCADANEMTFVQNKMDTIGYTNPNCQLSSTCEFLLSNGNNPTVLDFARVYPNPFSSSFSLDVNPLGNEIIQVSVYDMTGKLVEKMEQNPAEMQSVYLGQKYASGLYNVFVSQGKAIQTFRLIKR